MVKEAHLSEEARQDLREIIWDAQSENHERKRKISGGAGRKRQVRLGAEQSDEGENEEAEAEESDVTDYRTDTDGEDTEEDEADRSAVKKRSAKEHSRTRFHGHRKVAAKGSSRSATLAKSLRKIKQCATLEATVPDPLAGALAGSHASTFLIDHFVQQEDAEPPEEGLLAFYRSDPPPPPRYPRSTGFPRMAARLAQQS